MINAIRKAISYAINIDKACNDLAALLEIPSEKQPAMRKSLQAMVSTSPLDTASVIECIKARKDLQEQIKQMVR